MDIVVDTGVLVEAMSLEKNLETGVKAIRVILKTYEECDKLVLSEEIRKEYYKKFKEYERRKLNFNVPRFLSYLESIGKVKYVEGEKISETKIDPNDVKFIAAALKTPSKVVIASQSNFLNNKEYLKGKYGIKVLTPEEYCVIARLLM